MELLQLKYFQTVARLEHMTKAAEELHIAQPALSKTISRLEQDVGVPLFDRQNRQIRLNQFGKIFLEHVESALLSLEEGKRQVLEQAGLERGRLFLATTNHKCDAEVIGSFLSMYPNINLRLTQIPTEEEKLDLLLNGEADFCITSLPVEHEEVDSMPFLTEEIFLAVPPGHRLADRQSIDLIEAAAEPFISLKEGNSFRELTNGYCREAGFEPATICAVDEFAVISNFVQNGMGVGFLTETAKEKDPSLTLVPIRQPYCRRSFRLIWLNKRYLSQAAQTFRDFLLQYYRDFNKPQ